MSNVKERVQKFCEERWADYPVGNIRTMREGAEWKTILTVSDLHAVLEENEELLRQLEAAAICLDNSGLPFHTEEIHRVIAKAKGKTDD